MSTDSLGSKETAAVLRKVLKAAFPATRFSITTGRGAGVSSVRVAWTDGPSQKAVESIAYRFEAGTFNGMTDSYDYDRSAFLSVEGTVMRPGCRFVFCNRYISAPFANRLIAAIAAHWGGIDAVPVATEGYQGYTLPGNVGHEPIRPDLDWNSRSWYACIRRAAEDRTEVMPVEAR